MARHYGQVKRSVAQRMNPVRKQEYEDGEMLNSDESAPSSCPRQVIHKEYAQKDYYMGYEINDGESGIRKQMDKDHKKMMDNFDPHKY